MAAARTSLSQILPESSILFLFDMQEKLRDNVLYFPQIVSMAARILKVARLLGVPVLLTEQYPQGLGPTVCEQNAWCPHCSRSWTDGPNCGQCCSAALKPKTVSCEMNLLVALDWMGQNGVFLSTSKILILQLVKDAAHPQFKEIQKIIKEPVPDIGLLSFFQGKNNPLLLNSRP